MKRLKNIDRYQLAMVGAVALLLIFIRNADAGGNIWESTGVQWETDIQLQTDYWNGRSDYANLTQNNSYIHFIANASISETLPGAGEFCPGGYPVDANMRFFRGYMNVSMISCASDPAKIWPIFNVTTDIEDWIFGVIVESDVVGDYQPYANFLDCGSPSTIGSELSVYSDGAENRTMRIDTTLRCCINQTAYNATIISTETGEDSILTHYLNVMFNDDAVLNNWHIGNTGERNKSILLGNDNTHRTGDTEAFNSRGVAALYQNGTTQYYLSDNYQEDANCYAGFATTTTTTTLPADKSRFAIKVLYPENDTLSNKSIVYVRNTRTRQQKILSTFGTVYDDPYIYEVEDVNIQDEFDLTITEFPGYLPLYNLPGYFPARDPNAPEILEIRLVRRNDYLRTDVNVQHVNMGDIPPEKIETFVLDCGPDESIARERCLDENGNGCVFKDKKFADGNGLASFFNLSFANQYACANSNYLTTEQQIRRNAFVLLSYEINETNITISMDQLSKVQVCLAFVSPETDLLIPNVMYDRRSLKTNIVDFRRTTLDLEAAFDCWNITDLEDQDYNVKVNMEDFEVVDTEIEFDVEMGVRTVLIEMGLKEANITEEMLRNVTGTVLKDGIDPVPADIYVISSCKNFGVRTNSTGDYLFTNITIGESCTYEVDDPRYKSDRISRVAYNHVEDADISVTEIDSSFFDFNLRVWEEGIFIGEEWVLSSDASVELKRVGYQPMVCTTNQFGECKFPAIKINDIYTLKVNKVGYKSFVSTAEGFDLSKTVRLNFAVGEHCFVKVDTYGTNTTLIIANVSTRNTGKVPLDDVKVYLINDVGNIIKQGVTFGGSFTFAAECQENYQVKAEYMGEEKFTPRFSTNGEGDTSNPEIIFGLREQDIEDRRIAFYSFTENRLIPIAYVVVWCFLMGIMFSAFYFWIRAMGGEY